MTWMNALSCDHRHTASPRGRRMTRSKRWPLVKVRVGPEQQFVLGLILVYLGDSLSRLFGKPFINLRSPAVDERLSLPMLSGLPYVGEALFQQRSLVYVSYLLALVVWLLLYRTRPGLHLRAVGEDPATADSMDDAAQKVVKSAQ